MKKTTENSDNITETTEKKTSEKTKPKEEENLYAEDALALAGLSFKEKLAYKRQLYKKRVSTMGRKEKIFYTIRYYNGTSSAWLPLSYACAGQEEPYTVPHSLPC